MNDRPIMIRPEHTPVISAALGMYMTYMTTALERQEMDVEELSDFMEVYTTAGHLWRKSLSAQGFDADDIKELLRHPDELDD